MGSKPARVVDADIEAVSATPMHAAPAHTALAHTAPTHTAPTHTAPTYTAHCQVLLDDIPVLADIGVLSAEIGVRQPLFIHVALDVVPPDSDHLDQTFDYRGIHAAAQALAQERIALIETFARRLAEQCLADPRVLAVDVRVDKPRAIPGSMARTRLRLTRAV